MSYNGQSISYDGLGNPLTYCGMTFTWQHGRELASVTLGGATTAYTYDETGSRVQKVSGGVTTTYHVVDGTLMEEVRSDGKTLTYLLDENGTKYGVIYNGSYYYYIFNLQGDVIGLYNSSGSIVARYVYDAWGKLLAVTDNSGNAITDMSNIANLNPIRYRGYYYDVETGFYYLQSRYYDPAVGRYVNSDDINILTSQNELLGKNLFVYCTNDPINNSDDSGYWKLPNWAKIAIGVVAIAASVIVTVATGGAAAPALIGALQVAGGSAAIGAILGGISGGWKGAIDGACSGFMWGGISVAASSLMKAAQSAGFIAKKVPIDKLIYNSKDEFVILGPKPGKINEWINIISRTGKYGKVYVKLADGGIYQLLDGHHRVEALKKLGYKIIKVYFTK